MSTKQCDNRNDAVSRFFSWGENLCPQHGIEGISGRRLQSDAEGRRNFAERERRDEGEKHQRPDEEELSAS